MHNSIFKHNLLQIPDAVVQYDEEFYAFAKAESLHTTLLKEVPWRHNEITVYGKTYNEPRLTQLYGDSGIEYGYSGIKLSALPWHPAIESIKQDIENYSGFKFNVCLVNLYRDGADSNGWHADNEKELGTNPVIASLSLGDSRYFHLKHNANKELRYKFELTAGSLLLMSGATQHHYKHQIAKTKKRKQPRINLTFRRIVNVTND